MRTSLRHLILTALQTHADTERTETGWMARCLHCGHKLEFDADGTPWGGATLEHIVPRSWFGKRTARPLTEVVGEANDARNLAVACWRCNTDKGHGPDARGPGDERAREIVKALLDKRLASLVQGDGR